MTVETGLPLHLPNGEELNVLGDEEHGDDIVGRMPIGDMDPSDFDAMPVDEAFMTAEDVSITGEDEEPQPFVAPKREVFPRFKAALRRFQQAQSRPRVVRIDTENSYGEFVCESALRELERRLEALEARFDDHLEDSHAHQRSAREEVVGAVKSIATLRAAKSADDAANAMPTVPVELPPFAEGKVKCWKDGDTVVCSMRFQAADGKARMATMAAKPKLDGAEVAGCLVKSKLDPVTLLGILPEVADVACAKRLVKEVAGAALKNHRRVDVFGMDDEPLLLPVEDQDISAPLAAFMDLEQRADAGDVQAAKEYDAIKKAAETPTGRKVAAPIINEAHKRLKEARAARTYGKRSKLAESYMQAAGWL